MDYKGIVDWWAHVIDEHCEFAHSLFGSSNPIRRPHIYGDLNVPSKAILRGLET